MLAGELVKQAQCRLQRFLEVAVSRSASVPETIASSWPAPTATGVCAFTQNSHSFIFETYAAISSRSATDHFEEPRIASWVTFCIGTP
jgi:hypothetical protein